MTWFKTCGASTRLFVDGSCADYKKVDLCTTPVYNRIGRLPKEHNRYCTITMYNGYVHAVSAYGILKWTGSAWELLKSIPEIEEHTVIEYNGELHVIFIDSTSSSNNSTYHYKWNGASWVSVCTIGTQENLSSSDLLIYNNELHLITYYRHYKFNGSSWVLIAELGFRYNASFVYNGAMYAFDNSSNTYLFNGTTWSKVEHLLPNADRPISCVYLDNAVYIFSSKFYLYKYDGTIHRIGNVPDWVYYACADEATKLIYFTYSPDYNPDIFCSLKLNAKEMIIRKE